MEDGETAQGQARATRYAVSQRDRSGKLRKINRGSLTPHLERIEQIVDVDGKACP
ncbi:hypothetical protein HNO88_004163 [Novosphingobium chloroacetimidivorans]|uniref:Uncharacterized protein n=1 Tax=Novosphingobium chloroacetimidivorans TaxID=1428314 RepID=A0A7W7KEN4_9SPHN|nr:hypothetical protein [Novosphingobium chloroacetimidivorans]MBB4860818.1 hypothetical protein [Novosphingobium chloroacetimidivorans]